ncbi:hypothetical protein N4G70_28985 [Streptomyces sp. ASQP_92]|uniref:hypothetical protein n=1 Tax=Streptomyces sp. ASQP_92 TaxID=2979116 RepID=UPI0021BEAFC5|nr:hypothetical protein [Streptomyces sp. ASQP_92]MCT9092876.1 hypothetical protein [Streptomyces sp. ASQP_92]
MGKTYDRTPRDAKKAGRELKRGDRFYITQDVARNLAPYEDAKLYSEYTVTGHHPLLGGAMVGGQSVEGLCLRSGPLHTTPPKGLRNVATPGPQVAGPLGNGDYEAFLDEAELRGLAKQVTQGSDPRKRRLRRDQRP